MEAAARSLNHQTYQKGGTLGIKGCIYQLKWLMLFLHRGVLKGFNFRLATEMESAEKFDDIFFEYVENGNKMYRFLQVKHKENEQKGITFDDLLNEGDGNFALLKYFNSYRKIKQKEEFQTGILRDIIICTNLEFNFGEVNCTDIFNEITCDDDILNIYSENASNETFKRYKFKDDFCKKKDVYSLLRKASFVNRVATKLANCFLCNKLIEDHQVNSIFKECSGIMVREILDVESKQFRTNFLISSSEELPESVAHFRNVFRKELEEEIARSTLSNEKSERKVTELLNLKTDILEQIHVAQEAGKPEVKLNLSKNFGKKAGSESFPCDSVSDKEIKDFLNVLVFAVNQPNEEELGVKIQEEIGKEFSVLRSEDIYNRFFIKMLDWMKAKHGRFISHEDGKALFENARQGLSVWFGVKEPVESFTGRAQELKLLHSLLQSRTKLNIVTPCVIGLGGVGKSELVRKYVQEYSQCYEHNIIWINAESNQTVENSFFRLAKEKLHIYTDDIDVKQKRVISVVDLVYKYFAQSECLFIFDNAPAAFGDEGIDDVLPNVPRNSHKPYIIITSRNQNWKSKKFRRLLLDVFTPNEAFEFINIALNLNESKKDEVLKLADELQYLPLALQQAVSYIKQCNEELKCVNPENEFSISQYLEELREKSKVVLNFSFPDANVKTTYMTWNITVEKIKKSQLGEEAIEILNILAYLISENIPTKLFLPCAADDERKLGKILLLLKNYSMISIQNGLISIHRLVQKVHRLNLEENAKHEIVVKKCIEVLIKMYPLYSDLLDDCSIKKKLIPHFENILSIAGEFKDNNLLDSDTFETVLNCLADGYGDLGEPFKERNIYKRLVKRYSSNPGDLKLIRALIGIGTACGDMGNFKKQKNLIEDALSRLDGQDFKNKTEVKEVYTLCFRSLVKLGTAYDNLEDSKEALKCFKQSLKMVERVWGRKHHEYASVLKHLAVSYGRLGFHTKERDLLEEAFPILEQHYGSEHYIIGAVLGMLGAAYSDLGDDYKAVEFLEKSLEVLENYYGSSHFQVGDTLSDLGISLFKLGQYSRAKEVFERSISITKKYFGKDSSLLICSLKSLSAVHGSLGNRDKEIRLLKRVIRLKRMHNIDPSPTVAELRLRLMGVTYEYGVGKSVSS